MGDFIGVYPDNLRQLADRLHDLAGVLSKDGALIKSIMADGYHSYLDYSILATQTAQAGDDARTLGKRADLALELNRQPQNRSTTQPYPLPGWGTIFPAGTSGPLGPNEARGDYTVIGFDESTRASSAEGTDDANDIANALKNVDDPHSQRIFHEVGQALLDHKDDPAYLQAYFQARGVTLDAQTQNAAVDTETLTLAQLAGSKPLFDQVSASVQANSAEPAYAAMAGVLLPAAGELFADDGGTDDGVLYSRGGARSNLDVFENGGGLPRTPDTVADYAQRAGVDLEGVDVHIVDEVEEMRYLDWQQACACAQQLEDGVGQIRLGPSAFSDEETLVRTLAHERTHVGQFDSGVEISAGAGDSGTRASLEDEAYASEDPAWDRFNANAEGPGLASDAGFADVGTTIRVGGAALIGYQVYDDVTNIMDAPPDQRADMAAHDAGSLAGGLEGAEVGGELGAEVGTAFGPAGTVVGGLVGGVVGGVIGSGLGDDLVSGVEDLFDW